ncbi:DUF4836 family protein [Olivibacter sitiensis]|uniref:DUF4836 family protein n=1 Tax=Olivibacter sitiensis TaxID=376470 RepID=UPI0003F8E21E|nr:hypothetical protein [Olivibacter sitiensis]
MKKSHLFIASLLLLAKTSQAQDLSRYIPKDATAVATFKSAKLFELIGMEQFNNSKFGESLNKSLQGKNIDETGLDLKGNFYYFLLETDSTTTHGILLPMAKRDLVINTIQQQLETGANAVQYLDKTPYMRSASGKDLYSWKDNCLVMLSTNFKYSYFIDDSIANKYGIERYSPSTSIAPYYEEEYAQTDSVTGVLDSLYDDQNYSVKDVTIENPSGAWENYDNYYEREDSIKRALQEKWTIDKLQEWHALEEKSTLQTNAAFLKNSRKDALASIWINDLSNLYQEAIPPINPFTLFQYPQRSGMRGFQWAEAHLICNEREAKIVGEIALSPSVAQSFKKIYDKKINRKLLAYAPLDSALSIMSISINTKEYLRQLPVLMSDIYSSLLGMYGEEVELAGDLMSLLIDEEAIGNVVLGDGLFWVNGINEFERTYMSYEYDDNYNYKEIEKTKTERLPDFSILFSSKDQSFFKKLLQYGKNRGKIVEEEPGIFRLQERRSPMDLYLTMRKGIVALGTSKGDITNIAKGKKAIKASRKNKNIIRGNNFAFLVNSQPTREILWKELALDKQNATLNTFIQRVSDVKLTSKGVKDSSLVGEIGVDVPRGSDNGLTYLLDLIGSIATSM